MTTTTTTTTPSFGRGARRDPRAARAAGRTPLPGRAAAGGGACDVRAAEVGAAAAAPAATPVELTSVGALLAGRILQDGETILMILRPSAWFIVLSGIKFVTAVAILVLLAARLDEHLQRNLRLYLEAGIFLAAGRIVLAALQWTGRLYVLTDLRVLRLSGIFALDLFECPLRKVANVQVYATMRERLFRLGSIEITPHDEKCPPGAWQMVGRPREVQEAILHAIHRAKQSGSGA